MYAGKARRVVGNIWYVSAGKPSSRPVSDANSVSLLKRLTNLQATKLFIVTSATKGGWLPPLRFSVRFKILYRVIQPLIQHCLLRKMVYLNILYVIATGNYEFFTTGIVP